MQAEFLISNVKWIFLKSRIKHSIEAVIHVLINLITLLENKWQNKKSFVLYLKELLFSPLSLGAILEEYESVSVLAWGVLLPF